MGIREKFHCTVVDPEAEELKRLRRAIKRNRAKHEQEQKFQASMDAARQRHLDQVKRHKAERKHTSQMQRLANRNLLCILIGFGVFLCWLTHLVTLKFFLGTGLICACIIAFTCGMGCEKQHQFGGNKK